MCPERSIARSVRLLALRFLSAPALFVLLACPMAAFGELATPGQQPSTALIESSAKDFYYAHEQINAVP